MVDTWATVGSCAQIGQHVHLSGGVGIGGVLEPVQAAPVIIEDNCFIGSRCIVVEGVREIDINGDRTVQWGEVRLGVISQVRHAKPDLITVATPAMGKLRWTSYERGLRLRTVVDQLDYANFPQHGYRFTVEAQGGRQDNRNLSSGRFLRLNMDGNMVRSFGGHTVSLYARAVASQQPDDTGLGGYTLGGFHQLSGYNPNQLSGNSLLFTRATYYRRLNDQPFLSRGFFVGGTLEAGNTWLSRRDINIKDMRYATSVFLGSDTGLGPLYVGIGYAPRGGTALYVFIGRP